ncbi:MAG: tRNA lysidine(34) synthetase TilS [Sphingomicrobium sp.]
MAAKVDTKSQSRLTKLPPKAVERFTAELARIAPPGQKIGLGVSGGPDSLALLLLAAAARPGEIEVATVDHGLRAGSADEAKSVAKLCGELGIEHRTLPIAWDKKPQTRIQELARVRRYGALAEWARERGIKMLATAHHADDQAETMIMRLRRGAGLNGLAGMRHAVRVPGGEEALIRPLLGWRHATLEKICDVAGVKPVRDPSNEDEKFERVRIRKALGDAASWLGSRAISASASHLADADAALTWAANREWFKVAKVEDDKIELAVKELPRELRRRLLSRAINMLATEGRSVPIRGRQSDRLMFALSQGKTVTLKGVLCAGGKGWTFTKAPARKVKA